MRLILKSLQTEMRGSFNELSHRMDNLDTSLNERIDRILLRLDTHIKETASNFRGHDEHFKSIDERFDKLPGELMDCLSPYFNNIEKMLANHEDRITVLEQKH